MFEFDAKEGTVVVWGSMASVWEGNSRDSDIVQQGEEKKKGRRVIYCALLRGNAHHICPNPEGRASNRESAQRRSVFQLFEGLFAVAPRSNASLPVRQLPLPLTPFLMAYRNLDPCRKLTPGSQYRALAVITREHGAAVPIIVALITTNSLTKCLCLPFKIQPNTHADVKIPPPSKPNAH